MRTHGLLVQNANANFLNYLRKFILDGDERTNKMNASKHHIKIKDSKMKSDYDIKLDGWEGTASL